MFVIITDGKNENIAIVKPTLVNIQSIVKAYWIVNVHNFTSTMQLSRHR